MYSKTKVKFKEAVKSPYFAIIVFGIIIAVIGSLAKVLPPDLYTGIVVTSYYAIAGLGFALLLGYGGLASLGSGAFFGLGAFGFHYLYRFMSLPFLISTAIALVIAIVVAIIFGFISLRISGMYLAIITMGLSQIVIEIIKKIKQYASGTTGGFLSGGNPRPPILLGIEIKGEMVVVLIAIVLTLGMIIIYNLMKSPTGRALLAIKNSESAARTMGVNVLKYRLMAFVISGIYGAVAGILGLLFNRNSNVNSIGLTFALNMLAAVVIGGTRSIWGIVLGIFVVFGLNLVVIKPIESALKGFEIFKNINLGNYSIVLNGVLIIVVVMFYPNGLIQVFSDIKAKIKKRKLGDAHGKD